MNRCPACCSTWFYNTHWKTTFCAAKRKKGMGIYRSDHDHDCLTSMRFADDVLLFAYPPKKRLQKMLCEFKKSTEKVGLRVHPGKTKILSNQSTINSDEIFGSENLVLPTRNDRNQEPYQGCMGDLPQIQKRVDIEKLYAQTPSTAFRRHSISDCLLRSRNVGTQQRTRKNDSIDATQDATPHHPDKKEIQKDCETRYWAQRRKCRS